MNTKRLSDTMEKALSDQMNKEIHASHVFLSYGIWADDKGYQGIANFFTVTLRKKEIILSNSWSTF
ncbi:hypothetical protein ACFOEQ_04840 [Chryseobacterium arachidis]|uniref:hypothetical protein n=1 Tax=Chryseobacterium arachidis TaxID=1416778 RepID=UPI003613449D